MHTLSSWIAAGLTLIVVSVVVALHYEALSLLNRKLPTWQKLPPRLRILALIVGLLVLHLVEIGIFGASIHLATHYPSLGSISGTAQPTLLDALYLSATTYSTLGFGDLVPQGPMRIIVGIESLVGLLLITWSASFTYLEMQAYWPPR